MKLGTPGFLPIPFRKAGPALSGHLNCIAGAIYIPEETQTPFTHVPGDPLRRCRTFTYVDRFSSGNSVCLWGTINGQAESDIPPRWKIIRLQKVSNPARGIRHRTKKEDLSHEEKRCCSINMPTGGEMNLILPLFAAGRDREGLLPCAGRAVVPSRSCR